MRIDEAKDALMAWSRSSKFQAKIEKSTSIIAKTLEISARPYVAFSCGKDSSVLAHLVLRQRNIPLRFLSSGETRLIHNVDDVIGYFRSLGAEVEEICIDRVFSDGWKDASWTEQRKAGKHDLQRLGSKDFDCVFMGLRKEESKRRQISLNSKKTDGYPPYTYSYISGNNKGVIRCCPLAEWKTIDIAAYIAMNNIPTLGWYDYEGIEGRTTARLTGDAVRQNALSYIRQTNPDAFNRLTARFPELRMYV